MVLTPQPNIPPVDRGPRRGRSLAAAITAFSCVACLQIPAAAADDVFQQAINYAFTGTIDSSDAPEITDRKTCVVVMVDPKTKRFVRYYLARLGLDDPRIDTIYSGRQPVYKLDVESDKVVVEYLGADKTTVVNGYRSAQISLPGDIDQTKRALQLIADRCKQSGAPKLPF
jgi:hypothetical protein